MVRRATLARAAVGLAKPAQAPALRSRRAEASLTRADSVTTEDTLSLHRDEIEALARLAQLDLGLDLGLDLDLGRGEDGIARLAHELDRVLGWLAGLQAVEVEGVPETDDSAIGAVMLREDVAGAVLDREAVLAGVPAVDDGQVVVPRFVEE
jgi:aspartyl-tRNA(Asn)/glutamyl-tRNA(Gln) amidotransferase subunit C